MLLFQHSYFANKTFTVGIFCLLLLTAATLFAAQTDEEDSGSELDNSLNYAKDAIRGHDYGRAVGYLKSIQDTDNADVFNLLGYSYRKLGQFEQAMHYYRLALQIDAQHKGAHEYLGELFLQLNQPEQARKHLAILAEICQDCEEFQELKTALDQYQTAQ